MDMLRQPSELKAWGGSIDPALIKAILLIGDVAPSGYHEKQNDNIWVKEAFIHTNPILYRRLEEQMQLQEVVLSVEQSNENAVKKAAAIAKDAVRDGYTTICQVWKNAGDNNPFVLLFVLQKQQNLEAQHFITYEALIPDAAAKSKVAKNSKKKVSFWRTIFRSWNKYSLGAPLIHECAKCGKRLHEGTGATLVGDVSTIMKHNKKRAHQCPACMRIFCGACSIEADEVFGRPKSATDYVCPFCRTGGIV